MKKSFCIFNLNDTEEKLIIPDRDKNFITLQNSSTFIELQTIK